MKRSLITFVASTLVALVVGAGSWTFAQAPIKPQWVIALNEEAFRRLHCAKRIDIVPGATHLFEEPKAMESVSRLARQWFDEYLTVKRPENAAPTTAW